jgi:hypothetical protein
LIWSKRWSRLAMRRRFPRNNGTDPKFCPHVKLHPQQRGTAP